MVIVEVMEIGFIPVICIPKAELYKNEHAQQMLKAILDNVTWLNIHGLPVRKLLEL